MDDRGRPAPGAAEKELEIRLRQLEAVTVLGRKALEGTPWQALLNEACALMAGTLDAELCKVLELLPDGTSFLLRAGVGWREGLVGSAIIPATRESQAGYTYESRAPVIVEDLAAETRFRGIALLCDHEVVSGMSVVIGDLRRPYGILGVHTRRRRTFSPDDIRFLQTVAHILAVVDARRQVENLLRESETRWQFALEGAGDGVWDWNAVTNEVFFSRQWKAMLGYGEDEIGNALDEWDRRVHPDDKEGVHRKIRDHFEGRTPAYSSEHRILCKNGEYKWVLDRGKVMSRTPEGAPLRVIGAHTDITERVERERRIRHHADLLTELISKSGSSAGDPLGALPKITELAARAMETERASIWFYNADLTEVQCRALYELGPNRHSRGGSLVCRVFPEYTMSHRLGQVLAIDDVTTDPRTAGILEAYLKPAGIVSMLDSPVWVNGRLTALLSFEHTGRKRRWLPEERQLALTLSEHIAALIEASERLKAEAALRASLQEKEVLLREIHHRVKNNMQVISSLLNLQAASLEDPRTREMFKDSQNRIRSMALVHESLYRSGDLAKIDFPGYLGQLGAHLEHFHGGPGRSVRILYDLDPARIDVNTAVPLGLIVNELVSNAFKHAFPAGQPGEIRVSLKAAGRDGPFRLVVADNGVGLPAGLDVDLAASLGLQIVSLLTGQIDGTLTLAREGGTAFTIDFGPLSKPKGPAGSPALP